MTAYKLFLWVLISYGATQIIVESTLFMPIREWVSSRSTFFGTLITCMLCGGTWVSAIVSLMIWSPADVMFPVDSASTLIFTIKRVLNIWADAMVGSACIWFLHLIDNKLS